MGRTYFLARCRLKISSSSFPHAAVPVTELPAFPVRAAFSSAGRREPRSAALGLTNQKRHIRDRESTQLEDLPIALPQIRQLTVRSIHIICYHQSASTIQTLSL